MLNRLGLNPGEDDPRLFKALSTVRDPADWLVQGLGISREEARLRWQAATDPEPRYELRAQIPQAVALACHDGPMLLTPGDAELTPLLPGYFFDATVIAWSPDGQRLMLSITPRLAIVDFTADELIWVPDSHGFTFPGSFEFFAPGPKWLSSTTIAYLGGNFIPPANPSVWRFFDVTDPQRHWPELSGIGNYRPSPDRTLAATSTTTDTEQIELMPLFGGSAIPLGRGQFPLWSPDSRTLVYASAPDVLTTADRNTLAVNEILSASALTPSESDAPINFLLPIAWSPDAKQIAFIAAAAPRESADQPARPKIWVGRVNADGARPRRLQTVDNGYPLVARFSTDGQYFAVNVYQEFSAYGGVLIFKADTGALLQSVTGLTFADWSPTGHQLLLNAPEGVHLWREPDRPLEKLTDAQCFDARWNPAK